MAVLGDTLRLMLGIMLTITTIPRLMAANSKKLEFTKSSYAADIMENAVPKTNVVPRSKMGVFLPDSSMEVKYKVTEGDTDKLFKPRCRVVGDFCFLNLRTRTGISTVINRERRDKYHLTVTATATHFNKSALTAECSVTVYISDANDLNPLFFPTSYHTDVPEDTALYSSVLQVTASDADIGINGEIYYSLQEKSVTFAIHPTSGVLTLMRPLQYLEKSDYMFNVQAADRGPRVSLGSRVSMVPISIRVLKVNRNAPTIELQVLPAVGEEGMVETIYAILYVHDVEDGSDMTSVAITDGNEDGFFKLEAGSIKTQYNIKVAKSLDREIMQYGYNLTIEAVDKGTPVKRTTRLVHVALQDTNDHPPRFTRREYAASVEECLLCTVLCFLFKLWTLTCDKTLSSDTVLLKPIGKGILQ